MMLSESAETDKQDNSLTTPNLSSKQAILIALTYLLLTTCVFFRKPLFEGKVFSVADHAAYYVPIHVYNARLRSTGQIPLWNRHGFLGYPNQAETELSGIYPPGLIFNAIRDPGYAYTLFIMFHCLIAMIGTVYLARVVGANLVGQTVAALVFVFGGTFVGYIYPAVEMTTFAWTPLILGLQLRAFDRQKYGPAAIAGLFFAVQTVGAFLQQSFYVLLIILLAMLNEVRRSNCGKEPLFAVKATLVTLAVGLGLSAPQILFCLEHMSMTELGLGFGYETQVQYSLPPHYLIQLLVPNLFGDDPFLLFSLAFVRIYWGMLSLGLFVLGWKTPGRFASLLRVVFVVGLILTLGRFSGVYILLSELPGFRQIHYPCRALTIVALAASILVGMGTTRVVRSELKTKIQRVLARSHLVLAAILLTVGVAAWQSIGTNNSVSRTYELVVTSGIDKIDGITINPDTHIMGFANSAMLAGFLSALCGLFWISLPRIKSRLLTGMCVVGLLTIDLLVCNEGVQQYGPSDFYSTVPPTVSRLRAQPGLFRVYGHGQNLYELDLGTVPGDIATLYGLDALNSGAGVVPKNLARFLGPYNDRSTWRELGLFNIKYFIVPSTVAEKATSMNPGDDPSLRLFDTVFSSRNEEKLQIYELVDWQPRVAMREEFMIVPTPLAAKELINSDEFSLEEAVVLCEPPEFMDGEPVEKTVTANKLTVDLYSAQRVRINVTVSHPGILVLSDLNYPGWQATSNGRPVKILLANGLVRGLALGPGRHRIEFGFYPQSFLAGLYISLPIAALLALWGIFAVYRRSSLTQKR